MTLFLGCLSLLAVLALVAICEGRLAVGSSCGGSLVGQGIFSSPNYPSFPLSGQVCQWTLTAFEGKIITVFFDDFDIGPSSYLDFYNGTLVESWNKLTTYSGSSASSVTITLNSTATVLFRNAQLSQNRGFLIMFYSSYLFDRSNAEVIFHANATLTGGGSFSTPGYDGWYPNSARCTWTLLPCERDASLKLEFKSFSLEAPYDNVTIYDGYNLVATYTGENIPGEITLGSLVTVVFSSDSLISSKGFLATFSTVAGSSGNMSWNPAAIASACSASCPLNVHPDLGAVCYAHDDPHMMTFDGRPYEMQKQGIFYLYKHDHAPIWVQAAFQSCGGSATCSCAVAVRFWDEVFVVDRCLLRGSSYRADKAYKLGRGAMMSIQRHGVGYMVGLPNGLTIYIGGTWAWIGTVDLRVSVEDRHVVQGLCGLYNGDSSDDGTYRCGFNATQAETPWMTWRVRSEEIIFASAVPAYPLTLNSCNCSHVRRNYTLPPGVIDATATSVPAGELSDGSRFDVEADRPGSNEDRPWPGTWTQATATAYCTDYIDQNPAISKCATMLSGTLNVDTMINDCVRDIYLTGRTIFALTALEASKEKCLIALEQNHIDNKPVLNLLCPNECQGRGTCKNGTCNCTQGFYGLDCSITPAVAPILRNSSANSNCTATREVESFCKWELVFGETFYNVMPRNPQCRIRATTSRISPSGVTGPASLVSTVTAPAAYISHSMLLCLLPEPSTNITDIVQFTFLISVANDGLNFSNSVEASRLYTPPCGGPLAGSGRIYSPNYPSQYRNNAECQWNLTASPDKVVSLFLATFILENDNDFVRVYDRGFLIDTFTGNQQKLMRVYGRSVALRFTSNQAVSAKGFSLYFNSTVKGYACAVPTVGGGTLASPNYPLDYPSNSYCLWTLSATPGKRLQVQFNAVKLEDSYDNLDIYSEGRIFASVNGDFVPPTMLLNSTATLIFRSDVDTEFSGFSFTYTSI